ncbi:MAG: methyltransferase [Thermoplasmatales archaeon]|nr:methyltransferase [Thermoplasmatales archaeon]
MIDIVSDKTFHFNRLEIDLHPDVYDLSEDSFLLLEAIQIAPEDVVLEIGTGCGLIALEASRQGARVICTDINPYALRLTRNNIKKNKHLLIGSIEVRKGDLFTVVKDGELFDIILFNPPYLPTSEKEKVDRWFDMATDGGKDGLAVTKRFLKDVQKYLSSNGRAYFVFSSLSDRLKLEEYLKKETLRYEVVLSSRFHDESLDIYCVYS